jgi:hypothetical protein
MEQWSDRLTIDDVEAVMISWNAYFNVLVRRMVADGWLVEDAIDAANEQMRAMAENPNIKKLP